MVSLRRYMAGCSSYVALLDLSGSGTRLKRVVERALRGEPINISVLGGSGVFYSSRLLLMAESSRQ